MNPRFLLPLLLSIALPVAAQSTVEIFSIQGSGPVSPYANQTVTTAGNVVTAVAEQGFFTQTPESRSDGNLETSDGIYVFTSSSPNVSVGDEVTVSGVVKEYFDLTEFERPNVTVTGSGKPLPSRVDLDAIRPSADRNELERFEGMRVHVEQGTAVEPTDRHGNFRGVASTARVFRKPGTDRPSYDIFEVAANGFLVPAGSAFTATGALTYAFGYYRIIPTGFNYTPPELPRPVRARAAGELTVASLNLLRLVDDAGDGAVTSEAYGRRLAKAAGFITDVLRSPDVLAVQEAENLRVLQDLAAAILARSGQHYAATLIEGNDPSGIDTGFLTRDTVRIASVRQIGASERMSTDGSLLHDRPPLQLDAEFLANGQPFPFTVIAVHQRSMIDVETNSRVRTKRFEQAANLAGAIDALQKENPSRRIVVTGDFNAFEFSDGYVEVVGMIRGLCDTTTEELACVDLVARDLRNEIERLPQGERYSIIFEGKAQAIDHVLTSSAIAAFVRDLAYARGNADAPEAHGNDGTTLLRTSDHDAPVLYLMSDYDADGSPDDVDATPRGETRPPRKVRGRR